MLKLKNNIKELLINLENDDYIYDVFKDNENGNLDGLYIIKDKYNNNHYFKLEYCARKYNEYINMFITILINYQTFDYETIKYIVNNVHVFYNNINDEYECFVYKWKKLNLREHEE